MSWKWMLLSTHSWSCELMRNDQKVQILNTSSELNWYVMIKVYTIVLITGICSIRVIYYESSMYWSGLKVLAMPLSNVIVWVYVISLYVSLHLVHYSPPYCTVHTKKISPTESQCFFPALPVPSHWLFH